MVLGKEGAGLLKTKKPQTTWRCGRPGWKIHKLPKERTREEEGPGINERLKGARARILKCICDSGGGLILARKANIGG